MMENAAEETGRLIEFVFKRINNYVVGAGIANFFPAKRFFEFSKAVPGVSFRRIFRGDTPEIEIFETFFASI